MFSFLYRAWDRSLGRSLAKLVRPPEGGFDEPEVVYDSPDDLPRAGPITLDFAPPRRGTRGFEAVSPARSHWPGSETMRGQAFGRPDASRAIIVLHAAYEKSYTFSQWTGAPFVRNGYKVYIPAAPCHLDRTPPDTVSGAPMFWSSRLTVAGMAQWLVEIRALVDYLRGQGCRQVGLCGYSIGSIVAGLAATIYDDLDFVVLLAPVGDHLESIRHSPVAGAVWPWMTDIPAEDAALLERWAPERRQPVVDRTLFLMTLCDELSPTPLQHRWWNAWNRPPYHEYSRGHLSLLFCRKLYRDLRKYAEGQASLAGVEV